MTSSNSFHITRIEEEAVAEEVLRRASEGVVTWRELLEICYAAGISMNRLRKILLALIEEEKIIELKCRIFTSKKFLETTPTDKLLDHVKKAVLRSNIRKCGKPLGIPFKDINIIISKSGNVIIVNH